MSMKQKDGPFPDKEFILIVGKDGTPENEYNYVPIIKVNYFTLK